MKVEMQLFISGAIKNQYVAPWTPSLLITAGDEKYALKIVTYHQLNGGNKKKK